MVDKSKSVAEPVKLPRLPKGSRISKRPLLHPPVVGIKSSDREAHKTIYISTRSPFLSTVKRVEAYIKALAKREQAHILERKGRTPTGAEGQTGHTEDVIVKATGKAIDKALRVALFYISRDGYRVRLRTGSVGAVDDVIMPSAPQEGPPAVNDKGKNGNNADEVNTVNEDGDEISGSRIRRTSMLEVAIRLE